MNVLGAAALARDVRSSAAGQEPGAAGGGPADPVLRGMFSMSFDLQHPYWPGMNWLRFKEADLAWARDAGFNTVYMMYNPYRSEQGAVAWQEDLPPNDPGFAAAQLLTADETAPDRFELTLEGDAKETDLAIPHGESS